MLAWRLTSICAACAPGSSPPPCRPIKTEKRPRPTPAHFTHVSVCDDIHEGGAEVRTESLLCAVVLGVLDTRVVDVVPAGPALLAVNDELAADRAARLLLGVRHPVVRLHNKQLLHRPE